MPTAEFQINFLRRIQWLLESSSYTSTYKFALLMAMKNLSIESAISDNSKCSISYEELAEQFVQLYWTQTLPFSHQDDDSVLKQSNAGGQAKVITSILKLQQETKTTSIRVARTRSIKKWQSTIKDIAQTIKSNPQGIYKVPKIRSVANFYMFIILKKTR